MTISVAKIASKTAHIELGFEMLEVDVELLIEEQNRIEFDKTVERNASGQGVDVTKVPEEFLSGGVEISLPYEVVQSYDGEWGIDLHCIYQQVMQVDLPNMVCSPLSYYELRDYEDCWATYLDVSAGKTFALLNYIGEVKVYVSAGAVVGDTELRAFDITGCISSGKLNYIKLKAEDQRKEIESFNELEKLNW